MASKLPVERKTSLETKLVVALYPYQAEFGNCLSLTPDQRYEVVDDSQVDWLVAINNEGKQGYIPKSYVAPVVENSEELPEWYVGDMTREDAEILLKEDGKEGSFVVRTSTHIGYSLSVYSILTTGVNHYRIQIDKQNLLYLTEKRAFPTLPELIYYHQHDGAGMISRLKQAPRVLLKKPPLEGIWNDDKWEIEHKDLIILETLGNGQFGIVKRGKLRAYRDVAIKIMKYGAMSEEDFISEAQVMTKLHHSNLVQLLGICSDVRPIYIVTEYMKNGSLLGFLRKHREKLLTIQAVLLDICKQVCSGMVYLESQNCIHRDLAARNCLVGERKEIKISDFGLTRFVIDDEYISSAGCKFPIKWLSPEAILYRKFTSKSDVWSFGILMWEVYTCGDLPYGRRRNASIIDYLREGHRLERPKMCPTDVYLIMYNCWHLKPEKRPSFDIIKQKLDSVTISERSYHR